MVGAGVAGWLGTGHAHDVSQGKVHEGVEQKVLGAVV